MTEEKRKGRRAVRGEQRRAEQNSEEQSRGEERKIERERGREVFAVFVSRQAKCQI